MADRNDGLKPRDLAPGSVVLGRYTVQKILGRGGMATVYLARHQQTERLVALKMLDPELSRDPNYVERFRREARAAGRIRSDYVVAIYDLDAEVGGGLVLVMEYLEGQSVQQALRGGRMPVQKVLSFGRHMLEGLAAAHEAGVIHRDLKPANLFIERSSTGGEKLKILDFGISKLADASQQDLTRDGQTLGTVAYMAPEQIRGKASATDPRVDLYSAGVSLFLMLTNKRPIDADDTVQLLAAVLENPPLTLAQAAGVPFPLPLEQFIARALQKDPNARFQTALEMRDALLEAGRSVGYEATGPLQLPNAAPANIQPPGRSVSAEPTPSGPGGVSGVVSRSKTQMGLGALAAGTPRPTMTGMVVGAQPMQPAPMAPPPAPTTPPMAPAPMAPPPSPYASAPANAPAVEPFGPMPPGLGMPPSPMSPPTGPVPAHNTGPVPGLTGPVPVAAPTAVAPTGKRSNALVIALAAVGVVTLIAAGVIALTRRSSRTTTTTTSVARVAAPQPTAPVAQPAAPVQPAPTAPAPVAQPAEPAPVAPAPMAPAPVAQPAPRAPVAVNPPAPTQMQPAPAQPNPPAARTAPRAPAETPTTTTSSGQRDARPVGTSARQRRPRNQGIVEDAPF